MKKIAAIFLLVLFSFNWFGYRMVFNFAQHAGDRQLERSLDEDFYADDDLIELKVAMHMPYQTNRSTYERVDGEIEIEGRLYKYVKRKVVSDTLFLLCLPNVRKMQLETAKNDIFQKMNTENRSDNSEAYWSFFKDLQNITGDSYLLFSIGAPYFQNRLLYCNTNAAGLISSPHLSPEQPPELGTNVPV